MANHNYTIGVDYGTESGRLCWFVSRTDVKKLAM
jgi:ribulose kinase